jgi:heme A synthase
LSIFVLKITLYVQFIQKFHSGWAYLALLLLIVAVVISLLECFLKNFTKNRKIALFALIAIHVQLLVGIIYILFLQTDLT